MRTVTLSGTSNSGTIPSVGTPDSSTGRRSKSTTSTWNSRSQRELTVNQLSGKLGADHQAPEVFACVAGATRLEEVRVAEHEDARSGSVGLDGAVKQHQGVVQVAARVKASPSSADQLADFLRELRDGADRVLDGARTAERPVLGVASFRVVAEAGHNLTILVQAAVAGRGHAVLCDSGEVQVVAAEGQGDKARLEGLAGRPERAELRSLPLVTFVAVDLAIGGEGVLD